jgi:hypothetical protein
VAMFMQDPRSDFDRNLEAAIMTYLSKCNASLYATRATFLKAEMMLSREMFLEAVSPSMFASV